jgi:hypothetical protein
MSLFSKAKYRIYYKSDIEYIVEENGGIFFEHWYIDSQHKTLGDAESHIKKLAAVYRINKYDSSGELIEKSTVSKEH